MAVVLSPEEVRNVLTPVEQLIDQRMRALFAALGAKADKCSSCGAVIYFLTTRSGRSMPCTVAGRSHFADCPNAARHRRPTR